MSQTKIDYLTEDKLLKHSVSEQKYVCLSFLDPENVKNCNVRGLKVRGVFDDMKSATEHAKKLQSEDPLFHIFVGEVGKWLPFNPDADAIKDQNYYEDGLQSLMKNHIENREKAKQMEKQRKDDMLKSSAVKLSDEKKKNAIESARKKLQNMKSDQYKNSEVESEIEEKQEKPKPVLTSDELEVKQETEQLKTNEKVISDETDKVKTISDNIQKLKQMLKTKK
jgi:hypothetical protein